MAGHLVTLGLGGPTLVDLGLGEQLDEEEDVVEEVAPTRERFRWKGRSRPRDNEIYTCFDVRACLADGIPELRSFIIPEASLYVAITPPNVKRPSARVGMTLRRVMNEQQDPHEGWNVRQLPKNASAA